MSSVSSSPTTTGRFCPVVCRLAIPGPTGGRRRAGACNSGCSCPTEGVLFAVEWRGFWGAGWGARPSRMKDALRSANYHLARVPRLVPVHSNRYLPAGRGSHGSPVLSVYQADVTCCGTDLSTYIEREFGHVEPDMPRPPAPTVRFWSELIG